MELSPPTLILFLAASGYFFCNWCNLIRYDVLRDTGQRLYLTAALFGVVFYLFAYAVYLTQKFFWVDVLGLQPLVRFSAPVQDFMAQTSVLISIVVTLLLNKSLWIKEKSLERVWRKNDIDTLCNDALRTFKPVAITLENRKVYIGLVSDSLEPGKETHLTILPLYSGYRDGDTLDMKLTQKYTSVASLLKKFASEEGEGDDTIEQLNEYRIVIPRERIVTINLSVNSLHKTIDEPQREF